MADKVRLGFIGCGNIIRGHLEQGLKDFEDVEFVGWCDLREEAAAERRAQVGGQGEIFTEAAEMLDKAKPDAVFIALPTFAHGPVEKEVVKRRIPFFIEKPIAIDMATAARTLEAVKKRDILTCVGYMSRYREPVQQAKRLIEGRSPVFLLGGWAGQGPKPDTPIFQWWVRKEMSGGQFTEQATHTVDLARYFFGDAESVYAVPVRDRVPRPDFFTIEDAVVADVRFLNGAAGCLYGACCIGVGGGVTMDIHFIDMKISFTSGRQDGLIQIKGQQPIQLRGDAKALHLEDRAFINSVKAGSNQGILSTYEDGVKTLAISLAADKSMKTGKVVKLKDGGLKLGA